MWIIQHATVLLMEFLSAVAAHITARADYILNAWFVAECEKVHTSCNACDAAYCRDASCIEQVNRTAVPDHYFAQHGCSSADSRLQTHSMHRTNSMFRFLVVGGCMG